MIDWGAGGGYGTKKLLQKCSQAERRLRDAMIYSLLRAKLVWDYVVFNAMSSGLTVTSSSFSCIVNSS